jgi:hypothetical protein
MNAERTGNGHVYNSVESTAVGGVFEANCPPGGDGSECSTLTTLPVPPVAFTGVDALAVLVPGLAAFLLGVALLLIATLRRRKRGIS